jgi:hypothetical protein
MKAEHEQDIVSAAFVSDLSALIERYQPDVWIYGHTHKSDATKIGMTRMISNAKGLWSLQGTRSGRLCSGQLQPRTAARN